jgi:hypothetical protein
MALPNPAGDPKMQVLHRLAGRMLTEWAHAEHYLFFMFSALMKTDLDRARIVLAAQINFRSKRELIERLGRTYLPEEHLAEFLAIMRQVKVLSEKRNMLAHEVCHLVDRNTYRFFNDKEPTQPETFGRYQDVQLGNLKTWVKETEQLKKDLLRFGTSILQMQLLVPGRLYVEP